MEDYKDQFNAKLQEMFDSKGKNSIVMRQDKYYATCKEVRDAKQAKPLTTRQHLLTLVEALWCDHGEWRWQAYISY